MSICEHMISDCDSAHSSTKGQTPEEKLLNIQNELIWGLAYRNYKENEKKKPMLPLHSPINIPFELCRAKMLFGSDYKLKTTFSKTEDKEEKGDGEGAANQPLTEEKKKKRKKRKFTGEKPSLLDRNVWSQSKYMDYLSIPNPTFYEEPKRKRYKKRCELEPCPPRFVQLAVPNKRRVFANWKDYADFLPAEMLLRFEEILHTDQNLEPREARYYYKKLDRQKRLELKKKRLAEKKKKREKEKDSDWLKAHIDVLATSIVEYIQDEPLFALNYKQLLLSDGILDRLEATKTMKKPRRTTKNYYKKTIIEVSDKFAVWIDTLTKFVDVQAIESDVDIPPVSISSLSAEGEGESEEESEFEEESSSEEELRDSQLFELAEGWDEEVEGFEQSGQDAIDHLLDGLTKPGEGEGGAGLDDLLDGLHGDVLEKLIQILSNCSEDFLESLIDDERMPGVTYNDVLERLKEIRDGLVQTEGEKPFLEKIMIDWAIKNDPDNVNDEILQKIHEVAGLLGDLFGASRPKKPHEEGDTEKSEGEEEEEEEEGTISDFDKEDESQVEEGMGGDTGTEAGGEEGEDKGDHAEEGAPEGAEGEDVSADADKGEDISSISAGAEKGESAVSDMTGESFGFEFSDQEGEEGQLSGVETESALGGIIAQEYGEDYFEEEILISAEEGEELPTELGPAPTEPTQEGVEEGEAIPGEELDGKVIKGHKPSKVFEHSPDTVCCLSLKTWAVWLLEITHNAHNWTQWMSCVIQKIREYASIVRGDVKEPNGQTKLLRKAEWRKFMKETEESVVAWRQYSSHVKDLSQSIVDNFHGKKVNCCPKCLQDHLITNVVVAHNTLQALTEAISCAAYWQRCLDNLVEKTCALTGGKPGKEETVAASSEESSGDADIEEVQKSDESGESIYEIEGLDVAENK